MSRVVESLRTIVRLGGVVGLGGVGMVMTPSLVRSRSVGV